MNDIEFENYCLDFLEKSKNKEYKYFILHQTTFNKIYNNENLIYKFVDRNVKGYIIKSIPSYLESEVSPEYIFMNKAFSFIKENELYPITEEQFSSVMANNIFI